MSEPSIREIFSTFILYPQKGFNNGGCSQSLSWPTYILGNPYEMKVHDTSQV